MCKRKLKNNYNFFVFLFFRSPFSSLFLLFTTRFSILYHLFTFFYIFSKSSIFTAASPPTFHPHSHQIAHHWHPIFSCSMPKIMNINPITFHPSHNSRARRIFNVILSSGFLSSSNTSAIYTYHLFRYTVIFLDFYIL